MSDEVMMMMKPIRAVDYTFFLQNPSHIAEGKLLREAQADTKIGVIFLFLTKLIVDF